MIASNKITLTLSVEDAHAVEDALAYYHMAADNNYGGGYERGNPDDAEARAKYRRAKKVQDRISARLEKIGYY